MHMLCYLANSSGATAGPWSCTVLTAGCCCVAADPYGPGVTVAKVQVGLQGPMQALKRDLDALAATADTSSPQGLHQLLQGALHPLLRPLVHSGRCKVPRTC
jgi:hypothetical protein